MEIQFYDFEDRENPIFSIDANDSNIPRIGEKVLILDGDKFYDESYVAEVLWVFGSSRPGGYHHGKYSAVDIILRWSED